MVNAIQPVLVWRVDAPCGKPLNLAICAYFIADLQEIRSSTIVGRRASIPDSRPPLHGKNPPMVQR